MAHQMAQNWPELPQQSLEALKRFAHTAWNDPSTLRGSLESSCVEYVILGEHFTALGDLCAGLLQHDKILVRQEYRDILKALQTSPLYKRGAYVTGQPGIGKTYFLIYVLIERLREHKPVAFQPLHGRSFYALFTDTVTFHSFDDPMPLSRSNDAWALTDSGPFVTMPASVFLRTGMRIIQSTSPNAHRWKEWSKQYGARRCVMNVWTEKEITDLALLCGLNVETMSALATKLGGVPRTLLYFYDVSQSDIEVEIHTAASSAITSATFLSSLEQLNIKESGPSLIFFALPRKDPAGHINRSLPPHACVPTPTLVDALGKALWEQSLQAKVTFFQVMEAHPGTRRDGGNIYKRWLHPFFLGGQVIKCQWHVEGAESRSLPATIWTTTNVVLRTQGAIKKAKPPFYWIAPMVDFPGIDSVLVTKDAIFAIQVTIAFEHSSPQKGLDKLRDLLPRELKNLKWRVLYVGLEENQITRVSHEWARALTIGTEKKRTAVPVGWCVVDPVTSGVTYDESIVDEE